MVVAAALLMAATGCGAAKYNGVTIGHAIQPDGPQENGILGANNIAVGRVFRFAFPLLNNTSKAPLSVTRVHLDSVPKGIKVLGYHVYLTSVKDGYALDGLDGGGSSNDMTKHKSYSMSKLHIAPGRESDYFAMVAVTMTHDPSGIMSGCRIYYRQKNREYTQLLNCKFFLHTNSSHPFGS
jgi:hypothetical protein